ncbi:MAG: PLP-dependent decarboxylase, partial [Chlamydiales bacterium]|nr:PLP-dependent decarboxylase [Chlamydiales bacterium]
ASSGELRQVLRQGVEASRILLTGPAKSKEFLKEALDKGVKLFIVESHHQLENLEQICREMALEVQAFLRFQLDWDSYSDLNSCLGGSSDTAFGLDIEGWQGFDFTSLRKVHVNGAHVFQWGNVLDLSFLASIWGSIIERILDFEKVLKLKFDYLDLGGGLGLDYDNSGKVIEINDLERVLKKLNPSKRFKKILFEFGRYLVGPFGNYYTQIIDKKKLKEKTLLVLQGGINHLLRPALTKQGFPVKKVASSRNGDSKAYYLHGPLCTAADNMGKVLINGSIDIGDYLEFSLCGAYGFTESMPFFLCHELAAEFAIKQEKLIQLRKAENASIWLK